MFFYLCFCSSLLIISAQSGNLTLSEINHTKKISSKLAGVKTDTLNKTNLTLVSEGGTLLPNTPDLSKEKLNSLITLDEELSKTKEKAVVPRKGVDMLVDENNSSQTETKKIDNLSPETINASAKIPTAVISESTDIKAKPLLPTNTSVGLKLNNIEIPKKPRMLSYEALVNMEKQIHSDQSNLPVVPSTKTMASSQIPSPNQDSLRKVYPSKANNSHPGMIMPIVITILVVPMFAIVGYFALKRGQEAWKNRHYKRMDFLLDGMYND